MIQVYGIQRFHDFVPGFCKFQNRNVPALFYDPVYLLETIAAIVEISYSEADGRCAESLVAERNILRACIDVFRKGSPVTGQFPVFFYSDIQHPLRYIYSCRRNSVFVQGNGGVARSTRYVYDLEWSNARPFAFAPF